MTRKTLILVGASGSGKTATGRRLADETRWNLRDTDALILAKARASKISDIFDKEGEAYFRALEQECVEGIALEPSHLIVATGGGLPVIPGMMDRLMEIGVVVYLKASDTKLWTRLSADPRLLDDRPLLRGDGLRTLGEQLANREMTYLRSPVVIDTEQLSLREVTAMLVAQINAMEEQGD